jgi:Ran GTPase-activating protein (RanGAP) involved in mRNA processing and transport
LTTVELGAALKQLTNLRRLDAANNALTELPVEMAGCENLTEVDVSNNLLRTLMVRHLPGNLTALRLEGNPVADRAMFEAQDLADQHLACATARCLTCVDGWSRCRVEDAKCGAGCTVFESIAGASSLSIRDNQFTQVPDGMKQMGWLEQLDISSTSVLPATINKLAHLPLLAVVNASRCGWIEWPGSWVDTVEFLTRAGCRAVADADCTWVSLAEVDLSANALGHVNPGFAKRFDVGVPSFPVNVFLAGNPIESIEWFATPSGVQGHARYWNPRDGERFVGMLSSIPAFLSQLEPQLRWLVLVGFLATEFEVAPSSLQRLRIADAYDSFGVALDLLWINAPLTELWLTKRLPAISDGGLVRLADALRDNRVLEFLGLELNTMDVAAATAFAEMLQVNTVLATLRFWMMEFRGGAVTVLNGGLVGTRLERLLITDTSVGYEGAVALGGALNAGSTLQVIELGGCEVGDVGAIALADGLLQTSVLEQLALWKNAIGDEGAVALGHALTNSSLIHLQLYTNSIGNVGAAALADGLKSNRALRELDLRTNEIGAAGVAMFVEVLETHAALVQLDFRGNPGNDGEGMEALMAAASERVQRTGSAFVLSGTDFLP